MKLTIRRTAGKGLALAAALILLFSSVAPALAEYATLQCGSQGSDVITLQKALQTVGFYSGDLDGKFGKSTERAVKLYQESVKLTADGKAGNKTLSTLYAAAGVSDATTTGDSSSGTTSTPTDTTTTSNTSSAATTRVSSNPNTLEYGDSGDKVTELQNALVKLGYNPNGVDGQFGAGTRKAVVAFQKANGLTADGLAGTRTQTLLYSKVAAADTADTGSSDTDSSDSSSSDSGTTSGSTADSGSSGLTRTLRKGYTGSDVTGVQTQLKTLGYYTGSLDGVYGTGTMAAVTAFQKMNGLTADGLVGSKTYARLFSSDAATSSSPSGADTSGGSADTSGNSGSTDTSGNSGSTDTSGNSGSTDTSGSSGSSDSGTYVSLSYGANGDAVKTLQKALKALGYLTGDADGDYGALTQTAVTRFQKLNGLTADGTAGALTQEKLYGGSAVAYDHSLDETTTIDDDTGKAAGPSASEVKCLYWFTEVKPNLSTGSHITVFDPATHLEWTLRVYSRGHHADSEPLTATDTAIQYKAFGYVNTWTPKAVYVQLPSGVWTLASMHDVPHLSGSISDNNFDGHLCVHFLRTLEECAANDPDYGMTHQNTIRKAWKALTGQDIAD